MGDPPSTVDVPRNRGRGLFETGASRSRMWVHETHVCPGGPVPLVAGRRRIQTFDDANVQLSSRRNHSMTCRRASRPGSGGVTCGIATAVVTILLLAALIGGCVAAFRSGSSTRPGSSRATSGHSCEEQGLGDDPAHRTCTTDDGVWCTNVGAPSQDGVYNDPKNCGACGHVCGDYEVCVSGQCQACPQGLATCYGGGFGLCIDLQTDKANCGSCDHACSDNDSCINGQCPR